MMRGGFSFARHNWRWLLFAFLGVFFGSSGQTFFVAFFVPTFQRVFELSPGDYGTLYSAATMCAALVLGVLGRLIDRMPIWKYAAGVAFGLSVACLFISVSQNLWMLFGSIVLIRLCGQGLMTHVAVTSLAKKFDSARGAAMSLALLGFGAGEIIYPRIAPVMLSHGWRTGWMVLAAVILGTLVPTWIFLIRRDPKVVESGLIRSESVPASRTAAHHATAREVLQDFRFFLVLPSVFLPGLILTALFLFQLHLAETKGWSEAWLAQCFAGFAIARALGGLIIGPFVDRVGSIRLFPFVLAPMAGGLLVLNYVPSLHTAWMYLALCGFSVGIGTGVRGAFWAETYGTLHLGAIRSFLSAGSVVATGVGAIVMGQLLDGGVSLVHLLNGAFAAIFFSMALALVSCRFFVVPAVQDPDLCTGV